ncbi:MAG TPA: ComF family protein [Candidatus Acidoferrales bacterium]|jgi:competence protein ComFC|nr:ComF family protein [Candidatus Acidoferrales bacterium]
MAPVAGYLKPWFNRGLGLFYPEVCQLCNSERATAADGFVGPQCWSQVRFIRPPFCDRCGLPFQGDLTTKFECTNCREMKLHFTSARSAVVAKTAVLEAIHRFKYSRALWFESFLADLLRREATPVLRGANWDFIVPVPLHPLKQREREFNQAEILARHLSVATNIPLNTKLLQRITPTATQTRLKRDQRAANMNGAFALAKAALPKGKRIVLIDDVFTTGATTNACAKVLRQAGALEVCVWTVARGL